MTGAESSAQAGADLGTARQRRRAAVVAVGDELITGQKLDSNSQWVSGRLLALGVLPVEHATVPDEPSAIEETLRRLVQTADVVVVTGGLGPTPDDVTRDALAAVLGEPLEVDPELERQIGARLAARGRTMTDLQRLQAMRPASARPIENELGSAPGLIAAFRAREEAASGGRGREVIIALLPGPPSELRPMFERIARELAGPAAAAPIGVRLLTVVGIGESDAAAMAGDLLARDRSPLVGITASDGVLTLRIRVEPGELAPGVDAATVLDGAEAALRERLGRHVVAAGAESLTDLVVDRLRESRAVLATVESCTGGMVAQRITGVAGASDVFAGGWVTYSNGMKRAAVGVREETLSAHGAVSAEVAREMALGGLGGPGATHALAITGIAGPDGGSPEKPVGTVWIGLARRSAGGGDPLLDVRCFRFPGARADVRSRSAQAALCMLLLHLSPDADAGMKLLWEAARALT